MMKAGRDRRKYLRACKRHDCWTSADWFKLYRRQETEEYARASVYEVNPFTTPQAIAAMLKRPV